MKSNDPVIILASERSGSNLLRSLLDNHSRICAPLPPHLLLTFDPLRYYYGDLRNSTSMVALLYDMLDFLKLPYHNWGLDVTPDHVYETYAPISLIQAFNALYLTKSTSEGKERFCSKEIESFNYAIHIKAEYPSTKFIYLVRDPRDHVASWMKRPIHLFTPYDAIQKWITEQQKCLELILHWGFDVHIIKYEELISDPRQSMSTLLDFLEEEQEETCFQTNREKGSTLQWNPYWKNLVKPVMQDNRGTYQKLLHEKDIQLIETLAQDIMCFHQYVPSTNCKWKNSLEFEEQNAINRERNKSTHQERLSRDMPLLLEKFAYMEALRKRLERGHSTNNITGKLSKKKGSGGEAFAPASLSKKVYREVRVRLKFLLQFFFGESLTKRMIKNLRTKKREYI